MGASYGPDGAAGRATSGPAAVARVRTARRDPAAVLLQGVHAVKHAVRFGATLEAAVSPDPTEAQRLLAELAPDVELPVAVAQVEAGTWLALAGGALPSPLLAVARRPAVAPEDVAAAPGRLLVLERPRHLGNLGAAVRVAAAAGVGGVLVVGDADPWHPTAVRAAAGLQFALRVARSASLPALDRPVVALDPAGTPLRPGGLAGDAALLVGTERAGLSPPLRERADTTVAVPMRPGVSSLNLATAVAAALYGG